MTRYVEKMRQGNSSGGKLELIGLSSLFEINIIVFHLLTQEKPQFVVENNYTYKQVALFKEDKEQYSLLIHKTAKAKYSIYKRPQIVEINKESKYCESPIQENDFSKKRVPLLLINFMKMHLSTWKMGHI